MSLLTTITATNEAPTIVDLLAEVEVAHMGTIEADLAHDPKKLGAGSVDLDHRQPHPHRVGNQTGITAVENHAARTSNGLRFKHPTK